MEDVNLDSQGPWYSLSYAFDRIRYHSGFATLTDSSTLRDDIKGVERRLIVSQRIDHPMYQKN